MILDIGDWDKSKQNMMQNLKQLDEKLIVMIGRMTLTAWIFVEMI